MILRTVTIVGLVVILTLGTNAKDPLKDPLPDLGVSAIGVEVREISDLGKDFFTSGDQHPKAGVLVTHVETNSPAAVATVKNLDIITNIHGSTTRTVEEFLTAVSGLEIDKKYNVTTFRRVELGGKLVYRKGTLKVQPVALRDVYLNALQQVEDQVTNLRVFKHRSTTKYVNNQSEFYCYFTSKGTEKPNLSFSVQHVAEDWLFIRGVVVKADDKSFTVQGFGVRDVERDNGDGKIWEWFDKPVSPKEREMLEAVANAAKVIIRLEGDKYKSDRELSRQEQRRFFTVLMAYRITAGE